MILLSAYTLIKESGQKFVADKAPRLGAALAFYTTLSLAPMLVVIIGVASLAYTDEDDKDEPSGKVTARSKASGDETGGKVTARSKATGKVTAQLKDVMGEDSAKAVEEMLKANKEKGGNTLSTIVGLATLLFAATGLFAQLQDAMNAVWKVEHKQAESGGLLHTAWELVRDRLLSLSMVAGLAFLMLVSTVFGAIVAGAGGYLQGHLPGSQILIQVVNITLATLLTAAMFAMIFKILPLARVAWSDAWVGAALTAVLFGVGKFLISLYLGTAGVKSSYGAAGSLVLLLIWVYYSTQILLFGACFTYLYATKFGSGVRAGQEPPAEVPKTTSL